MEIIKIVLLFAIITNALTGCIKENANIKREDVAIQLDINLPGSLQNPAFSPDGSRIVFTHFRKGYNRPPADLYLFNLETKILSPLMVDGFNNVNLPGTSWNNELDAIAFSSERELDDEIYYINENGVNGDERRITGRPDSVAFEPTFSPDGQWIVFETHKLDDEKYGVITKYKLDGSSGYVNLTPVEEDNKQPNWSPSGDKILYQKKENNQWDIWMMNIDGSDKIRVTNFEGNKTDAVFSKDGQFIIFSSDFGVELANIYKIPISGGQPTRLTYYKGYDGAPAISPNASHLIFESSAGDPDRGKTSLWLLEL